MVLLGTAFFIGMASGIGLVLFLGLEEKPEADSDSKYFKLSEPKVRPEFPIHWEDYDE